MQVPSRIAAQAVARGGEGIPRLAGGRRVAPVRAASISEVATARVLGQAARRGTGPGSGLSARRVAAAGVAAGAGFGAWKLIRSGGNRPGGGGFFVNQAAEMKRLMATGARRPRQLTGGAQG